MKLLCKFFGHKFKYNRRYYRCTRCGVRRCDIAPKGDETPFFNNVSGMYKDNNG